MTVEARELAGDQDLAIRLQRNRVRRLIVGVHRRDNDAIGAKASVQGAVCIVTGQHEVQVLTGISPIRRTQHKNLAVILHHHVDPTVGQCNDVRKHDTVSDGEGRSVIHVRHINGNVLR